ncbi:RusA family crossover junction endodeoxyribonuclease [Parafrankia sp. FMc6]|uniref:RusA family crossover junction endodeoxyribonuclease n=1 Tax=Parafrankia soli TaxID=2599596 RepID=UPI0034D725C9
MTSPPGATLAPGTLVLEVAVYGTPGAQGSKRHVGGGRMIESSKAVAPWRADVKAAAEAAMSGAWSPLDGPLKLDVTFTRVRPASAPKRRRAFAATAPDLDKYVRSTCDALTAAGVWMDDGRVVEIHAAKVLVGDERALDRPGALIRVWVLS